mmetsp:Transcript_128970/g.413067  ORF Transcript_128970/g.413067 Transcript_128970/m.413067 type:complete len:314 (-) Transcript_128970:4165-5106(-)
MSSPEASWRTSTSLLTLLCSVCLCSINCRSCFASAPSAASAFSRSANLPFNPASSPDCCSVFSSEAFAVPSVASLTFAWSSVVVFSCAVSTALTSERTASTAFSCSPRKASNLAANLSSPSFATSSCFFCKPCKVSCSSVFADTCSFCWASRRLDNSPSAMTARAISSFHAFSCSFFNSSNFALNSSAPPSAWRCCSWSSFCNFSSCAAFCVSCALPTSSNLACISTLAASARSSDSCLRSASSFFVASSRPRSSPSAPSALPLSASSAACCSAFKASSFEPRSSTRLPDCCSCCWAISCNFVSAAVCCSDKL